jgi:hypothetical protein
MAILVAIRLGRSFAGSASMLPDCAGDVPDHPTTNRWPGVVHESAVFRAQARLAASATSC